MSVSAFIHPRVKRPIPRFRSKKPRIYNAPFWYRVTSLLWSLSYFSVVFLAGFFLGVNQAVILVDSFFG